MRVLRMQHGKQAAGSRLVCEAHISKGTTLRFPRAITAAPTSVPQGEPNAATLRLSPTTQRLH